MSRIQRSALVPFTAQQMFDLVNDVPAYPSYMSGCVGAEVLRQGEDWMEARLDLAKAGFKHSFVTRNTLHSPHTIDMELVQGPFSSLKGKWLFESLGDEACKVSFFLEYKFSNKLLGVAMGKVFESIASNQVDQFCQRAKQIYS